MTHYGPSPLLPDSTILGLAGDGTSVVLWIQTTREPGLTLKKEMTCYEAINLARRLLIEATALLKRGV
jgi:hypothetical protein